MSLIFSESFDTLTVTQMTTSGKWLSSSGLGTSGPTGVAGRNGYGWRWNGNPTTLTKRFSTTDQHATLIVGMARYHTLNSAYTVMEFYGDSGSTCHIALYWASGLYSVYKGFAPDRGSGTLLGTMAAADTLINNTWIYEELKVLLSDTVGTVDLRINGINKLSLTGQDTRNLGTNPVFNQIFLQCGYPSSGNTDMVDDLYVCNGAGAANNDFLGDVRIETMTPSADGNYSQWTPRSYNRLQSANVSGIETDATGWSNDTNAAVARVTTPVHGGSGALQVTASGAGTMSVKTAGGTSGFPTTPSASYAMGAWIRAASTLRNVNIGIEWYDNAGATISRTLNSPAASDAASYSLLQPTVLYTAPVNAVFGALLVQWVSCASAEVHYLDDAFVMENSRAATDSTAEAGSLSTHYTAVNDLTVAATAGQQDQSYVVGLTNDLVDTWAHTDLASPSGQAVKGVVQYAEARADTASAKSLALVARSAATDATSADNALAQTYGVITKAWDLDPSGAAWTVATVNGAEFGVKVRP